MLSSHHVAKTARLKILSVMRGTVGVLIDAGKRLLTLERGLESQNVADVSDLFVRHHFFTRYLGNT